MSTLYAILWAPQTAESTLAEALVSVCNRFIEIKLEATRDITVNLSGVTAAS